MKIKKIECGSEDHKNVFFLDVDGLKATQSYRVIELLKKLKSEKFELAVEIGTQEGGFSLLIKHYLECDVYTWDIAEWNPVELRNKLFKKYSVTQKIEDCFEDKTLNALMRDKRKKIIFCDGGNKGNEFSFFARMLNDGDFIGAHDYFQTIGDRDDDIWTTCELIYTGIEGAVKENNMKQKYRDLSLASVWALYEKRDKKEPEESPTRNKENTGHYRTVKR